MRTILLLAMTLGSVYGRTYVFDRPICTGLGDRIGTMLSLAALARLENATVVYLWCEDVTEILPRIRPHVPTWVGFNYSLDEFRSRFKLPSEIKFVQNLSSWRHLPVVQWGAPLPAEMGSDSIPHIAWLTMRMGEHKRPIINVFQEAYRAVTMPMSIESAEPHIVFHMRGPDENTYWTTDHYEIDNFCTAEVVRALGVHGFKLHVISNNLPWAKELLGRRGTRFHMNASASAYDDFEQLLSASAIIQHAWGGWSSYSSVPALVTRVPMINTYSMRKPSHRFHHFQSQLGLPVNYYDCGRIDHFVRAVHSQLSAVPHHVENLKQSSTVASLYDRKGHEHLVSPLFSDSDLAPLTRWVQAYIHANQFIPDCSAGRFMVSDGFAAGFGAEMYAIGSVLGYALEHNHTLLLSPSACSHFTADGCESVLAPISNCVYRSGLAKVDLWRGHQVQFVVPTVFKRKIEQEYPHMTDKEIRYWWRGQSAAFVSRFNANTTRIVKKLRMAAVMPVGTINLHIRRGDKHLEMRLVEPKQYVEAAVELIRGNPLTFAARTLFLSGDDLEMARVAAESHGLNVILHSKVHHMDGGHVRGVWLQQSAIRRQKLFYEHLMQLVMALEADAWIGTRESNWNSLIDHLRCVWVNKCRHPYVEVGDGWWDTLSV